MKKPFAPFDIDAPIQCTSEWITDGRLLIIDKSMFRYRKPLDILVQSGKDFELVYGALKFDFKPHNINGLMDGDHVEFKDTQLVHRDYSYDLMVMSAVGEPKRREFLKRSYFETLSDMAFKVKISTGHMAHLFDHNDKLFAILMGCRPNSIEYLMKLEGSL